MHGLDGCPHIKYICRGQLVLIPRRPTHARTQPFKTALAARRPQVGLWLSMASPYLAEAPAASGPGAAY